MQTANTQLQQQLKKYERIKSRYSPSQESVIIHKCKQICCQIVIKIMLYQCDLRITYLLNKFIQES